MKKKFINTIIIVVIVSMLVIVKFLFLNNSTGNNSENKSKTVKQKELVTVYIVKNENIENKINSAGTILSDMETQLKSEVSGRVIKINFIEGSEVQKGQLLVKLNDSDLQAQLKKLLVQKINYEDKEQRQKELLKANGISQEEYDNTTTQLKSLYADIELIQAQIDKTEIKAPFNGIIGLRSIDEGQYINSSSIIASLQKLDKIKIDFSIPEQYSNLIDKNIQIKFKIKGFEEQFTASIYAIEPKIDQNTRSLMLRAICNNEKYKIYPGSFAEVEITLKQIKNALMIPTEAIIPILKGKEIFLYKSGKAVEKVVKTGIRTADKIQITDGVSLGDTVIITGIMQIRNGSDVKILFGNKKSKK